MDPSPNGHFLVHKWLRHLFNGLFIIISMSLKGGGWGGIIMDESSHGKVNMFSTTRIRTCILANLVMEKWTRFPLPGFEPASWQIPPDLLTHLSWYPGHYSIYYI